MSDSTAEQSNTRGREPPNNSPNDTETAGGSKKSKLSKRSRLSSTSHGKTSSPPAKRARVLRSSKSSTVAAAHKSKHQVVVGTVSAPDQASSTAAEQASSTATVGHVPPSKHKRHRGRSAKKMAGVERLTVEKSKRKRKKSRATSVQETGVTVTTLSTLSPAGSMSNRAATGVPTSTGTQPPTSNRLGYLLMEE